MLYFYSFTDKIRNTNNFEKIASCLMPNNCYKLIEIAFIIIFYTMIKGVMVSNKDNIKNKVARIIVVYSFTV